MRLLSLCTACSSATDGQLDYSTAAKALGFEKSENEVSEPGLDDSNGDRRGGQGQCGQRGGGGRGGHQPFTNNIANHRNVLSVLGCCSCRSCCCCYCCCCCCCCCRCCRCRCCCCCCFCPVVCFPACRQDGEVEAWAMLAIKNGLLDLKMCQQTKKITVYSSTQRNFQTAQARRCYR
jgi:hypothetical protein